MLPHREYLASLPRKRMAVGVVYRDEADRVLLVAPSYKDGWILVGGTVEADEAPSQAAARETVEELGLELPIGRLLVTRWMPPGPDDEDGWVSMDYDGGVLSADVVTRIALPVDELRDFRFATDDEWPDLVTPITRTRLSAARRALREGTVVELVGEAVREVGGQPTS